VGAKAPQCTAAEQQQRDLNAAHGDLVDAEDVVKDRLQAMEDAGRVVLTPEQEAALAVDFAAAASPADPDDLDRFAESSQRLAERLRAAVGDAEAEVRRVDDDLAQVFRVYKLQWDSPNLGATADSYPDYARILDDIRGEGLAARRAEWRRRLTEWSGQDLVPLVGAMAASVEEIASVQGMGERTAAAVVAALVSPGVATDQVSESAGMLDA
jgi:uncharacterized protein YPO0396